MLDVLFVLLLSFILGFGSPFVLTNKAFADIKDEECEKGGLHDFEVTIQVYATEDQEGVRLFLCKKCSYEYIQTIPATGHLWGNWIVEIQPSCEREGYGYRVCQNYANNPHYEEMVIPALSSSGEHSYSVVEQVKSTCVEEGYILYSCVVCEQVTTERTPPLGHSWGDWYTEVEPAIGEEGRSCRTCVHDPVHVEYKSIPALVMIKKEEKSTPPPTAQPDPPQPSRFFTFEPNVVDAAVWTADILITVLFLFLALPFVFRMTWIKRKRSEAYEKARQQAREKRS